MKHTRTKAPRWQRGHMDFSGPLGWALVIIGTVLTGGGFAALWAGIRMLLR